MRRKPLIAKRMRHACPSCHEPRERQFRCSECGRSAGWCEGGPDDDLCGACYHRKMVRMHPWLLPYVQAPKGARE